MNLPVICIGGNQFKVVIAAGKSDYFTFSAFRTVVTDQCAFMQTVRAWIFLPMTLLAKEALFSVANPKSPILTEPVGPVMKMLSHFRSL